MGKNGGLGVIDDRFQKLGALYAVSVLLLVTVTGGTFAVGSFHDRASTSGSFSTAADFTADLGTVGNEEMDPGTLRAEGTHHDIRITFDVRDVPNVSENDSRITFRFTDHGDPVRAADIECDSEPYERDGTCTVTFEKRDLLMETAGTGNRSFAVRGWWNYGRDFVFRGTIPVRDDGFVTDSMREDKTESGNAATDETTTGNAGLVAGNAGSVAGNAGATAGNTGTCAGNASNAGCSGDSAVVKHVALPSATVGRRGTGRP
ncbi:hypothetical protein [Halorientalis marina]|uniref:hypothetical protein n=1 Tax=Halorientalis marina TaxID=2931976 RepID=UPI001FF6985F|nr:hypothetical protein [Halorientalis marina]